MANIVPGANWRPIPIDYSRWPKRRKGRGLIGHIAVSSSPDLRGDPNGNCWTFYLPEQGPAIQQIDLDYVSGSSRAGDATCATFESQGGLGPDVNRQRWNANQVWWAARILRHLHDTEGVPLEVMENSLPTSRGFGTHRLGIDPYRVPGGESWSTKYGKECPGDARHAQRAEIVALARSMDGDDDMPTPEDLLDAKVSDETGTVRQTLRDARQIARRTEIQVAGLTAAVGKLAEAVASGRDDLTADELKAAVTEAIQNAGAALRAVDAGARA